MFLDYLRLCIKYSVLYFVILFIITLILKLTNLFEYDDIQVTTGLLSFIGAVILGYLFTLKAPEKKYIYASAASIVFCVVVVLIVKVFKIPLQSTLLYSLSPYFICFPMGIITYWMLNRLPLQLT